MPFDCGCWKCNLHREEFGFPSVVSQSPPEQNSLTKALSQFVIYTRNVSVESLLRHCQGEERSNLESTYVSVDITASRAVAMSLFINGHYVGSVSDFNHPLEDPVTLQINGTVLLDSLNLVR